MRRWWVGGLATLLIAGLGLLASAWRLPVEHVATVSFEVAAPPVAVWSRVRDWSATPRWKSEVTEVIDLGVVDGRQRFRECTWECLDLEIVQQGPPYVTRIVDHPDFGGTWTWQVQAAGAGSVVTIQEHGHVPNPVFRWFMHYVFGPEATMQGVADDLTASFDHDS